MRNDYSKYYVDMANMYVNGATIKQIGEHFGCSNRPVRLALSKLNVQSRQQGSKYICDETFFNTIDSEYKAYWLGMIAADGSIRSNKNRNEIVLSLKEQDVEHIKHFLLDIGSTSKVYNAVRSGSRQSYASISSKTMKQDLIKYGVVPRKSLSLIAPEIGRSVERHFWRGCFDGDGCITTSRNKYWAVSFNGTKDMVMSFKTFIDSNICVNNCRVIPRCNIYTVSYRKQSDVKNIIGLLYSGSNRYLDRKYVLACKIIAGERP